MAVKIRLKRLGKIRSPHYRLIVTDSRKKRDGRAIEEIGLYNPNQNPSFIEIDSERAQYWLGVGAQPSDQVTALFKVTGDWQKFKGLPGTEGTYEAPVNNKDPKEAIEAAEKAAADKRAAAEKTKKAEEEASKKAEEEAAKESAEESKDSEEASEPAVEGEQEN